VIEIGQHMSEIQKMGYRLPHFTYHGHGQNLVF